MIDSDALVGPLLLSMDYPKSTSQLSLFVLSSPSTPLLHTIFLNIWHPFVSAVRNSREFAHFIQQETLDTDEVLVSFDVISLFTCVPINLALEIAQQRLEQDDTFSDRTFLTVDDIMSLLSLCLNATYFSFGGTFYKQVNGTAMGSPVSVVVANLVMEHIEDRALSTSPGKVRFWKRYVDDVCCSLPKQDVTSFLSHLNSMDTSIQFTCEVEDNSLLPFLDVLLHHNDDGSISTSVYHKPSHTARYLDFSSHHPISSKAAAVKTLMHRAKALSSSNTAVKDEESYIFRTLRSSNYPQRFVTGTLKKHIYSKNPGTGVYTNHFYCTTLYIWSL